MNYYYYLFYFTQIIIINASPNYVLVDTPFGQIIGKKENNVETFKNIPYAIPPIKGNRFEEPIPHPGFGNKFIDGTKRGPSCFQKMQIGNVSFQKEMSEDCLYLNIYRPLNVQIKENKTELLPVIIFIHGGAFFVGSSSDKLYDANAWISENDTNPIIFVTINYRLGIFGFLSLDNEIPENMGILDQRLAIQWIIKYIQYFGGDPLRVILAGESAGATSVFLHSIDENISSLINGFILHSAPFSLKLFSSEEATKIFTDPFIDEIGCNVKSNKEIIKCLKNIEDAQKMINAQTKIMKKINENIFSQIIAKKPNNFSELLNMEYILAPRLYDNQQPLELIINKKKKITKPVFYITLENDALFFMSSILKIHSLNGKIPLFLYKILIPNLFQKWGSNNIQKILQQYPPALDSTIVLDQLLTDFLFDCPSKSIVKSTVENDPNLSVYNAIISYSNPCPYDVNVFGCTNKSCHGSELGLMFNTLIEYDSCPFNEKSISLGNKLRSYWKIFAYNPSEKINWPFIQNYEEFQFGFLNITTYQDVLNKQGNKRCYLWNEIGYFPP